MSYFYALNKTGELKALDCKHSLIAHEEKEGLRLLVCNNNS